MSSIIKVDDVQDAAGNNIINEAGDTITIGASGDTISIPSGATIANSGTATGFDMTGWTTGGTSNSLIPSATDQGIYLGVSSATAANLLDDYETGTFTASTTGISYTQNTGYYRRIGDLVYIQVYIVVNTYTSGSRVSIGGLPFTSRVDHADGRYPIAAGRWNTLHVSTIGLYPFVASNGITMSMDGQASSGTSVSTNIEVWTSSTNVSLAGCYLAQ